MLEKIKNDKLKFATIMCAVTVFMVGIVMTAANTADTYALTCEFQTESACEAEHGVNNCVKNTSTSCWEKKDAERICLFSFYDSDGTLLYSHNVSGSIGTNFTIKTDVPQKDGFIFKGYSSKLGSSEVKYKIDVAFVIEESMCPAYGFYQVWEQSSTYTVKYDANGGSGAPSDQIGTIGVAKKISSTIPTRYGYEFHHWEVAGSRDMNLSPGGEYKLDNFVSNNEVTLVAVWTAVDACYKCDPPSRSPYYDWGIFSSSNYCSLQPSYTNEASCLANNNTGSGDNNTSGSDNNNASVFYVEYDVIAYSAYAPCYSSMDSTKTRVHQFYGCDAVELSTTSDNNWLYNSEKNCYVEKGFFESTKDNRCTSNIVNVYVDNEKTSCYSDGQKMWIVKNFEPCEKISVIKTDYYAFSTDNKCYIELDSINTTKPTSCSSGGGNTSGTGGTTGGDTPTETKKEYKIEYKLNNGTATGNPTSGEYDKEITINNPTKKVTIIGNGNKMDATIGKEVATDIKFEGWTSTNIDTKTAYHGDKTWTDGKIKVTDTKFKNLTSTNGATVTLEANFKNTEITLPTVTKEGYTCNWNTKSDGKGDSYNSGSKYIIKSDSTTSINIYAICEANSKTDEEIKDPNKIGTGDALIYTVWVVGIGALGYSIYYFMKRRSSL